MIALMIIGASLIPKLNIRYTPSLQQQELTLTFYWYGASARVIEQEVTSKIGIYQRNSGNAFFNRKRMGTNNP